MLIKQRTFDSRLLSLGLIKAWCNPKSLLFFCVSGPGAIVAWFPSYVYNIIRRERKRNRTHNLSLHLIMRWPPASSYKARTRAKELHAFVVYFPSLTVCVWPLADAHETLLPIILFILRIYCSISARARGALFCISFHVQLLKVNRHRNGNGISTRLSKTRSTSIINELSVHENNFIRFGVLVETKAL